ncbi:hypothetical protein DY000_02023263 [Brassica cretica]|uniref:Uncharacterized protein n=1 Tax=Brassica cretica TaxID=69181 RepID=A0ABQ7E4Y0_BRACR|nr:hypothetical protein DY000_02023263 [Brassica cretica]
MHGIVSYRRFRRARSLCSDRTDGAQSSTSRATETNTSDADEASNRPPGVKAAKAWVKKTKVDEKGLSGFQTMWSIKQHDLAMKERLSKMSLLDSLIGKQEPLSECEEALKKKLISDLLSKYLSSMLSFCLLFSSEPLTCQLLSQFKFNVVFVLCGSWLKLIAALIFRLLAGTESFEAKLIAASESFLFGHKTQAKPCILRHKTQSDGGVSYSHGRESFVKSLETCQVTRAVEECHIVIGDL